MRSAVVCLSAFVLSAHQGAAIRTSSVDVDEGPGASVGKLFRGQPVQNVELLVEESEQEVAEMSCEELTTDMLAALARVSDSLETLEGLTDPLPDCEATPEACVEPFSEIAETLSTENFVVFSMTEAAYRKNCSLSVFERPQVKSGITAVLDRWVGTLMGRCQHLQATNECTQVYQMMVAWQHGVQQFNDTAVFHDELLESDHCPEECQWCSREHKSLYKEDEDFQFKCVLKRGAAVPTGGGRILCETPKRRFSMPWQKKTWCVVNEWKLQVVRQAQVSSLLSCSMLFMQPGLLGLPPAQLQQAHRVCRRVEQGFVVSEEDWRVYNTTFFDVGDQVITPFQQSFRNGIALITSLGTGAGLAELVRLSADPVTGSSVIDEFTRGFATEGGEAFFNEPVDDDFKDDVCEVPRIGGLVGLFGLFFRMSLHVALYPVGIILVSPVIVTTFFSLVVSAFRKNVLLGIGSIVGSPIVAAIALGKVLHDTWVGLGKFLKISDWDCAPSKLLATGTPQCIRGMYWNQRKQTECDVGLRNLELSCRSEFRGALVYEAGCPA